MARVRTTYRCGACGTATPKWAGRCSGCGAWGALVEGPDTVLGGPTVASGEAAMPVTELDEGGSVARATGIAELDRVLGGGLVPGSVTLLGGEPGIGKSTLLLQVAGSVAARREPVLVASGEESAGQVRRRAERLGALHPCLWVAAEGSVPRLLAHVDELQPALVVVDSVQTLADPEVASAAGSVGQVTACAARLVAEAKARGLAVVMVGHVTKDGALAGPRVLEHVVDTVLSFEGDRHHALRLIRAVKHRFGPTGALGVFEMADEGLRAVPDASGLFLADRQAGVPGSVVVPTIDGSRPLLVEVQALVAPSALGTPRRSAQGVDGGRLALLLAVLERRVGLSFATADVFASAVGGVRLVEPATDLGLALALASSALGRPVPHDVVACGEVGLGGELRQVVHTPRRLTEAARLGFRWAIVPGTAVTGSSGLEVMRADDLAGAVRLCGLLGPLVDGVAHDGWPPTDGGEGRAATPGWALPRSAA
ncbi:MAG: DNA repair protein RadA [Acidimicrobiales bacterium]|nr:DNA repair protein RadA [Acidimicrobiales bacterium]